MIDNTPLATLTTHTIPLTHDVETTSIDIITDLFSPSECAEIIESHRNLVPSNVTAETVRTRQVFEDAELARRVWGRIERMFDSSSGNEEKDKMEGVAYDADGEEWRVKGLNERWRLCCYEAGGKFSPHQDERRLANLNLQSFMTINIYLNTLPTSSAGATRFFSSSPYTNPEILPTPAFQSQPITGTAALFRDYVWHDGEEVKERRKYLLRTDVMFERVSEWDEERVWKGLGREERARRCLRIAEGLEDGGGSGSGDVAVQWYKKAYKLWPELQNGG